MLSLSEPTEIGKTRSGEQVILAPMPAAETERLGNVFSAIEPWSRYPFSPEALNKHLSTVEPGAPRYLIRVNSSAAGTLTVRLNWLGGPYLQFLAVVPDFQGQGIGALALAWFEVAARKEKVRNLWVAVSDFNSGALRLYERHGFERVALINSLLIDGRDEVLLRKRL